MSEYDKYEKDTLNPIFNKEASSQDEPGQTVSNDNAVSDTASHEIYLRERFSEEHDAIDEHYRQETAKLAGSPVNTPSLGLGSDDPDTVQQKYEALSTDWSRDRERLAAFEDYSTERVRDEGQTLSGEFEASASQIGMPHDVEIANDDAGQVQEAPQMQFEQSAKSKGHSL